MCWNQMGPLAAAATSSIEYPDPTGSAMSVSAAPAALAVASSPSGCDPHCPPAGAHITGKLIS